MTSDQLPEATRIHRVGGRAGHGARELAVRARVLLTGALTQRFAWVPFAVVFFVYTGYQVRTYGEAFGRWDTLLLSGWATLILGLVAAQRVPERLRQTLARLADREVLIVPDGDLGRVNAELDAHSIGWATKTGCIVTVAIVVAFAVSGPRTALLRSTLLLLEMLGGFVAGFHLGRLASYGRLGRILRKAGCSVEPRPGHIDQAAGLKPIGDFFFVQAMIAGIPAAFLAVWWLIIPLYGKRYAYWRAPYLGLLVLAITLELLAFLVPMVSFHRDMAERKRVFLHEADKLSIEISKLSLTPSEKERLAASTERYMALEDMPTWPVDSRTRRRFRLNNLALVSPIVGNAFGHTELGKQVAEVIKNLTQ